MDRLIIRSISHCWDCPHLCNRRLKEVRGKTMCCYHYPDIKELTKTDIENIPEWCPLPNK